MSRLAVRKTDFGTILLHWALVGLLLISIATGLRIAIDSPYDMAWLHRLDPILPAANVWTWHIPAGSSLFALAISYTIYLSKAQLFRRVQPDVARLAGAIRSPQARLGAINVVLYWVLFLAIVMELVTGVLLYLGFAGHIGDLHLIGTMIIAAYIPIHILVHLAIGGLRQLLRVFNPGKLAPPQPPFDPFDVIARSMAARQAGGAEPGPPSGQRVISAKPRPGKTAAAPSQPVTADRYASR
jgi:cytochrome b subunit of formate dehydrogenase